MPGSSCVGCPGGPILAGRPPVGPAPSDPRLGRSVRGVSRALGILRSAASSSIRASTRACSTAPPAAVGSGPGRERTLDAVFRPVVLPGVEGRRGVVVCEGAVPLASSLWIQTTATRTATLINSPSPTTERTPAPPPATTLATIKPELLGTFLARGWAGAGVSGGWNVGFGGWRVGVGFVPGVGAPRPCGLGGELLLSGTSSNLRLAVGSSSRSDRPCPGRGGRRTVGSSSRGVGGTGRARGLARREDDRCGLSGGVSLNICSPPSSTASLGGLGLGRSTGDLVEQGQRAESQLPWTPHRSGTLCGLLAGERAPEPCPADPGAVVDLSRVSLGVPGLLGGPTLTPALCRGTARAPAVRRGCAPARWLPGQRASALSLIPTPGSLSSEPWLGAACLGVIGGISGKEGVQPTAISLLIMSSPPGGDGSLGQVCVVCDCWGL